MGLIGWTVTGATIFGLYLIFAGQVSPTEITAGIGATSLGVLATAVALKASAKPFAFARSDLRTIAAGCASLPRATWQTFLALHRALPSGELSVKIRDEPFAAGHQDAPRDRARRAAELFRRSLAPDGFVLRMAPGRDRITVHGLRSESDQP